ncbi:MAG: ABC transporter ATP-binding protein [Bacilli bacterium]|nr:ABC transporter ATP-binding protein [Bacilli bacterium]
MEDILVLENVSKFFHTELGTLEVLKDISFKIKKGEIVSIIGPSGSGKSTILNIISGLIDVSGGRVETNGEIGYMFQKDHLLEWRTIFDNIKLGLEIRKEETKENIENIVNLLEKYGLKEFINNYPYELSGGMRQRIALIRTLAIKPSLLLLDEPFSALDYQTRLMVSDDVYKIIKDTNTSTILVTHDISEAIALSDKIIVLSKRPANILNIHLIEIDKEFDTPLKRRTSKEFSKYFDVIWSELNEEK